MKDLGDGLHEQRLGQSGRASDETMPAGQQRNEDFLDDLALADDDLLEFLLDLLAAADQLLNRLLFVPVGVSG
jgi:hypothetical protein